MLVSRRCRILLQEFRTGLLGVGKQVKHRVAQVKAHRLNGSLRRPGSHDPMSFQSVRLDLRDPVFGLPFTSSPAPLLSNAKTVTGAGVRPAMMDGRLQRDTTSVAAGQAQHMLRDIGQDQVRRNRRHLIQSGFPELPLDVVFLGEPEAAVGLNARFAGGP